MTDNMKDVATAVAVDLVASELLARIRKADDGVSFTSMQLEAARATLSDARKKYDSAVEHLRATIKDDQPKLFADGEGA